MRLGGEEVGLNRGKITKVEIRRYQIGFGDWEAGNGASERRKQRKEAEAAGGVGGGQGKEEERRRRRNSTGKVRAREDFGGRQFRKG